MRDTFMKRDIDHQSQEVLKALNITEEAILKS
jgi:hypothetical protein